MRLAADRFENGAEIRVRRTFHQSRHATQDLPLRKRNLDPRADFDRILPFLGNEIVKLLPQGDIERHTSNHIPKQNGNTANNKGKTPLDIPKSDIQDLAGVRY